jgi:integrase
MCCGRPGDDELVFPARDGGPWSEPAYQSWRRRSFARAAKATGLDPVPRPYDLRHSFASLLLAEGRSVIDVATQLGHAPGMTLGVYGHVIAELDGAARVDPEALIAAARAEVGGCGQLMGRSG